MPLPKPAMKQSTYKKFNQDDKNCQSTKKYISDDCAVCHMCHDKNCQSAKPMCYDKKCQVKSEGTTIFLYAVSGKDCLQTDQDTCLK